MPPEWNLAVFPVCDLEDILREGQGGEVPARRGVARVGRRRPGRKDDEGALKGGSTMMDGCGGRRVSERHALKELAEAAEFVVHANGVVDRALDARERARLVGAVEAAWRALGTPAGGPAAPGGNGGGNGGR